MSNTLVIKNSSVIGHVPVGADLVEAELAVNTADKKLFTKDAQGNVVEIGMEVNSQTVEAALGFVPANQATTYTKTETDTRIQAVIGSAPEALNTLAEIATQLASDESAAASIVTLVGTKAPQSTTYTKTQVDTAIAGATPSFSTLTSKPTTLAGYGITDAVSTSGVAGQAAKLSTARSIALTGGVSGSVSFDGSANVSIATTLQDSGVTAGNYTSVTVDTKGRVTSGSNPVDIFTPFSVKAISTVNVDIAAELWLPSTIVGGYQFTITDTIVSRTVFLSNQTDPTQNGIYRFAVISGTTYGGFWTKSNITLAGYYYYVTALAGENTTLGFTIKRDASHTILDSVSATGVSAGTYKSITVDAKGRVTAGSNPTTLSGHGIVDAYTKTQVDTALSSMGSSSGSLTQDFSVQNLAVSGDIMPAVSGVSSIGSPTDKFHSIYTQELHIDANTLYVDGVPVIGSSANTIQITADLNQGLRLATTGTGQLILDSQTATTIQTNGLNADVLIQAGGSGSLARITSGTQVVLTAPIVNIQGSESISGDLTVAGNMTVNGTTTAVNTANMTVKDNIVTVNKGELGSGVSLRYAGFEVDRGDLARQRLVWDETTGKWVAGQTSQEVALATEPFVTAAISASTSSVTVSSLGLGNVSNTSDANKPVSTAQAIAIALKASSTDLSALQTALQALISEEVARALAAEATKASIASLSAVATSGSYNDLTNKPSNSGATWASFQ
jgi:hypothetical protein